MKTSNIKTLLAVVMAASTLVACGGGGGGGGGSSDAGSSTPAPAPSPAPSPSPTPSPAPAPSPTPSPAPAPAPVATSPAGTEPTVTAANCPAIQSANTTAPTIVGADMQAVSDVLNAVDTVHGLSEFYRLPDTFMWWARGKSDKQINMNSIGTAIHETNHTIDFALWDTCYPDHYAKFFANNVFYSTELLQRQTDNYSIISETYPQGLRISTVARPRSQRYSIYIQTAAAYGGNDFRLILDELNAYSGAAQFEVNLLSSSKYSYLYNAGDYNAGGMVDFMSFLQYYLKSARLNHASTYATIKSQQNTLAFIQFSWTRAEAILAAMYPYSVANGSTQTIPLDVARDIYSPAALAELDAIGVTHKTAADWQSTYFK